MHYLLTDPLIVDASALQRPLGVIIKMPYKEGVWQSLSAEGERTIARYRSKQNHRMIGTTLCMTLLLAFLIGFFAGLRSLTAPAATAWAVYLGWLKLDRLARAYRFGTAVAIFTVLALVELVADKLPRTPSRTAPPGLIARIVDGRIDRRMLLP